MKDKSWLAPVSVPCYDWKEESGEYIRKTVIIAPIHIIEPENGSMRISWACSQGPSCRDQNCRYSCATHNREADEQDNPEQVYEVAFS